MHVYCIKLRNEATLYFEFSKENYEFDHSIYSGNALILIYGNPNDQNFFLGLKRTGKSCRLRWLNYLRPDVRRGNITQEEQFLIMELQAKWGNRLIFFIL